MIRVGQRHLINVTTHGRAKSTHSRSDNPLARASANSDDYKQNDLKYLLPPTGTLDRQGGNQQKHTQTKTAYVYECQTAINDRACNLICIR